MWCICEGVLGRVWSLCGLCLYQGSGESVRAEATGQLEDVDCGLIISSIGYKSISIDPAVPFDPRRAIVPNEMGRVQDTAGQRGEKCIFIHPRGSKPETRGEETRMFMDEFHLIALQGQDDFISNW